MATIQRPVKEGTVRTYQEKVGLGYLDILASEMDADLDTIYAAWNGGIDDITLKDLSVTTPKIVDGAVTYAKLAPDAQLWKDTGTMLEPGPWFVSRNLRWGGGAATVKSELVLNVNAQAAWLVNHEFAPQELTWNSWALHLDLLGDQAYFSRRAANAAAGTITVPFLVRGSDGKTVCTLADASVTREMLVAGTAARAITALTMPLSYGLGAKNAWVNYAYGTVTMKGGMLVIVVEPSWLYSVTAASANAIALRLVLNSTEIISKRWTIATGFGPLPGITATFNAPYVGDATLYIQVYAENNATVQSDATVAGSAWVLELS